MKYAKEFAQRLERIPPTLQDAMVNYKQWKKACKSINVGDALCKLKQECEQVDARFHTEYQKWLESQPRFRLRFCLSSCHNKVHPENLLLYAETNAKTVYKICKRLQKTMRNAMPLEWLTSLRASHSFAFLGGRDVTHLTLKVDSQSTCMECPICMEDVPYKKFLIYKCGHYGCIECTLAYAKVGGQKGLWYNLISNAKRRDCPYCKYDAALRDLINLT